LQISLAVDKNELVVHSYTHTNYSNLITDMIECLKDLQTPFL